MSDEDAAGVWVFRLRPDVSSTTIRGDLPNFGHRTGEQEYRVIEDPEVAAGLKDLKQLGEPRFLWLDPETVDEALADPEAAVDAIEAGEYDDELDMLLVAERRAYGGRIDVIDAITQRNKMIREQRQGTPEAENVIQPEDILTRTD